MAEIWRKTPITFVDSEGDPFTGDSIGYRVQFFNNAYDTLGEFNGKAWKRPGAASLQIALNDLVSPYLRRGFTPAGEADTPWVDAYLIDTPWACLDDDFYYYDNRSYDAGWMAGDAINFPVYEFAVKGQWFPVCNSTVAALSGYAIVFTDVTPGGYQNMPAYGTMWAQVPANATLIRYYKEQDPTEYPLRSDVCPRFVLYYVNSYGGWDWLPILGSFHQTDGVARVTYDTRLTPTVTGEAQLKERTRHNHRNAITEHYTFNTDYLTEAQSLRMHHLLDSPCVWLHDLQLDTLRPLVLTGSSYERKQGGRLYQYTIEADLAQERIR